MTKNSMYQNILNSLSKKEEQRIQGLSFLSKVVGRGVKYQNTEDFIKEFAEAVEKMYSNKTCFYDYNYKDKTFYSRRYNINCPDLTKEFYEKVYKFQDILTLKGSDIKIILNNADECVVSCTIMPIHINGKFTGTINIYHTKYNGFSNEAMRILSLAYKIALLKINDADNNNALKRSYSNIIRTLMKLLMLTDKSTYNHSLRVKHYSQEIARLLDIPKKDYAILKTGALLHDMGKIAIKDDIINKPDKLTEDEFQIIKQHTFVGYKILKHVGMLKSVLNIVLNHHEKLDGSGYPNGIKNIDKLTQIVAVSDIIDALATTRAYKEDKKFSFIGEELNKLRCSKLDCDIIDAAVAFINSNRFLLIKKYLAKKEDRLVKTADKNSTASDKQDLINKLRSDNSNLAKSVKLYRQKLSYANSKIEKMMLSKTAMPDFKNNKEQKSDIISETIVKLAGKHLNCQSAIFIKVDGYEIRMTKFAGENINIEELTKLFSDDKLKTAISSFQIYKTQNCINIPINAKESVCFVGNCDSVDEKSIYSLQSSIESAIQSIQNLKE